MGESPFEFEKRKRDHIDLSLRPENEALGGSGLKSIQLIHEAFPELNFDEIDLQTECLGLSLKTPFLVSSMTAGHHGSKSLNQILAKACEAKSWLMGVGSQRRELSDPEASKEWRAIRKTTPHVKLLGNIGITQLIKSSVEDIQRLVDALEAVAMIIHTNPLQECFQPEGTPQFKGGLAALENLAQSLPVPVIVKETGCGFSRSTLNRLKSTGVKAVDISGFGGTHWGRIEGQRAPAGGIQQESAQTFSNWGMSTVETLLNAFDIDPNYEVWASGGVRSGLDAAKLIAMGANCVGFAKPILQSALESEESLIRKMETLEYELKTALFCTGCANVKELREKSPWQHQKI